MLQVIYTEVKFINVSISALGAEDKSCDPLLSMLSDLDTQLKESPDLESHKHFYIFFLYIR